MGDIEMPIGSVRNENVPVRPVRIRDLINLYARGKNIDNDGITEDEDACA